MHKSITYYFARTISNVFLPPVYLIAIGLIILGNSSTGNKNLVLQIAVVVLFGLLLPVAFFIYLMKQNHVADQDALIKEQRKLPYLFGLSISLLGLLFLLILDAPKSLLFHWSSYLLTVIVILCINYFWKISAHLMSVGVGSMVLVLLGFIHPFVFLCILIVVSWARLELKCHTVAQVAAGALTGSVIAGINYYIMYGH